MAEGAGDKMAQPELPTYSSIKLERDAEITWLVLNRPERMNALSQQLLNEMSDALDVLATHDDTRVIVIRGEGRTFSSGYDLNREEIYEQDIMADYEKLRLNIMRYFKIWEHPKPVIAAVHGYCLAGATQLAVFCDITVVAEDAEVGLAQIPAGGGYLTPIWAPFIGPKRAKQMSFVPNSRISGRTAADWGWANYAVPASELHDNVRALARQISKIPPRILRMKKMAINRVWDTMGFRQIALMGPETDALLHFTAEAQKMNKVLRQYGLKEAVRRFNSGEMLEE
jgi:enoyl-CoA hydratase